MFLTARAGSLQSDAQCGCGIESGTRKRFQSVALRQSYGTTRISPPVTLVAVVRPLFATLLCESTSYSHCTAAQIWKNTKERARAPSPL